MKKIFVLAIMLILAACSTSPPNRYYTLTALANPASQKTAVPLPSIGIVSVTVPELADRYHLVIGAGNNINILEFDRWGESLKSGILRVMAENLTLKLASDQVSAYPQVAAIDTALQIFIDFQGFSVTDGVAMVDALWRIKENGKIVKNGRTRSGQKITGNYETVAEAYSRALAVVSDDIAKAVVQHR